MPNIKSFINKHNKNVLYPSPELKFNKVNCPLNQNCHTDNVLYQAAIAPSDKIQQDKVYYRVCKTIFKKDMETIINRSTLININETRNCPTNFEN